jgi:hypothetical protein
MNDPASMRIPERPGDLTEDLSPFTWGQLASSAKTIAKAFPLDISHDEERQSIDFVSPKDWHNVRVRKIGSRARLAKEALSGLGNARNIGRQYLDRHGAIKAQFTGQVNRAHTAALNLSFDDVLVSQRAVQLEERGIT